MRIGWDVDGVIADFNTAYIARVIAVTGKDLFPPRPFDIPTWNYPESYGYTNEEVSSVWREIIADPWFWGRLPTYTTTASTIDAIALRHYQGDDIYFVTSRPGVTAKRQTERWLLDQVYRHAEKPPFPLTVLISSDKGLCANALALDHYIDDKWENALDVARTTSTRSYLLTQPWNVAHNAEEWGITRVASVGEFVTCIERSAS